MKQKAIRNNNPLNLRRSSDQWLGMSPNQSDPSFVQFSSVLYGFRAAIINLATHIEKDSKILLTTTISSEITRWAPPSENNTIAYIQQVCNITHLRYDHVLRIQDKPTIVALIRAMAYVECSRLFPLSIIETAYDMAIA